MNKTSTTPTLPDASADALAKAEAILDALSAAYDEDEAAFVPPASSIWLSLLVVRDLVATAQGAPPELT